MPSTPYASETVAILKECQAFRLNIANPFKLASGLYSPFYIDCRVINGHAAGRKKIGDMYADMIRTQVGLDNIDIIAGGVTAGVPFATMAADRLNLPLVYVRPEPKGHGTGSQIEGGQVAGKRVLLAEDLITNAGSKIKFAEVLRAAGADVQHTSVVFSRAGQEGLAALAEINLHLHSLADFNDLLDYIQNSNQFSTEETQAVLAFVNNPVEWSAQNAPRLSA